MVRIAGSRLELGEDPEFQRRFWKIQNAGWIVMALFLFAGMLGLFGGAGPLVSATSVSDGSHLTITHPRFLRNRAPIDLDIHLDPGSTSQKHAEIKVELDYIQRFDILNINPEPVEVRGGVDSVVYVFELIDPAEAMQVTFHMQPERAGIISGEIGLVGEPAIEFRQLIYP